MITTKLFDKNSVEEISNSELSKAKAKLLLEDNAFLWIDLSSPTEEEETEILTGYFGFHHLAIDDCRLGSRLDRSQHNPIVVDYGEYLFVILNPVEFDVNNSISESDDFVRFNQLSAFVGKKFLVTHHENSLKSINSVLTSCDLNSHVMERGPDYLYHLIIDNVIDAYVPVIEKVDDYLEDIEDRIFHNFSSIDLSEILKTKRMLVRMRNIMMYQREVLNRLCRGEFSLISEHETFYYRNVYDHLVRITELLESYRDVVFGLLEAYLTQNSNRMNQVMKVLTVISTIFLPLTFISSIYGMNFKYMPELEWRYGYFIILGLMLLLGVGMMYYFKKMKWLE